MLIQWKQKEEIDIPHLNQGHGTVFAKMVSGRDWKAMISRMPVGTSIGRHTHRTSMEINFVCQGTGMAICDGVAEPLSEGICHICPVGSTHEIQNTGR